MPTIARPAAFIRSRKARTSAAPPRKLCSPHSPEKGGVKGKKFEGLGWVPCVPWIPWPFTPAAVCIAVASDFRDGGSLFLTGTAFPEITGRKKDQR